MAKPIFISKPEFNIEINKLKASIKNHSHDEFKDISYIGHDHPNYITTKQLAVLRGQVTKIGKKIKIHSLLGLFTLILSLVFMFIGIKGWNTNWAYFLIGLIIFIFSLFTI